MRTCGKCGKNDATSKMGPPVCVECRGPHQVRQLRCPDCGAEHTTRSGNHQCQRCRHQAAKHPCAECGRPCDKRAQVCLACLPHPTGAEHPGYKGGRVKAHVVRGYVRVRTPKDHPRSKTPYMPEHVLVMEQMLGRYLLPGENVHHRNGIKHDNRPGNLELWVTYQPTGQRASDLLAWAREIIERYEPVEAVITKRPRSRRS